MLTSIIIRSFTRHIAPVASSTVQLLGGANVFSGHLERSEWVSTTGGRNQLSTSASVATVASGQAVDSKWPDSCSALVSSSARQRLFSAQTTDKRMATAQTMQQRSSLDLALANPVYQGGSSVAVCSSASTAGLHRPFPCPQGMFSCIHSATGSHATRITIKRRQKHHQNQSHAGSTTTLCPQHKPDIAVRCVNTREVHQRGAPL